MKRREALARAWAGWGLVAGGSALAVPALAAGRPATARSMVVDAVQMPAWTEKDGKRQPLGPGDSVTTAGTIETGMAAGLVLRMPEGSLVRLGEKTQLQVLKFEVKDTEGQIAMRSDLKLLEGFFRFATSSVAKVLGQREVTVGLRTATIGIRGTDFWSMTDAQHDATCLFEGKVDVQTRDQGGLTLDKPTAFWARFFDQPVKPVGNATPDELNKFLQSTEVQPGQGVAVVGGRWRVVAATLGNSASAGALQRSLRDAGYPAVVKTKAAAGKDVHEVRINALATRDDAAAILKKIGGMDGVSGRVALSA